MNQLWYEVKKAVWGKALGERIQMDSEEAKGLVEAGFLIAIEESPEKELLAKAMDKLTDILGPSLEKAVVAAVENTTKKMGDLHSGVSVTMAREDKTRCFGDFFAAVITNDANKLKTVYGADSTKSGPLNSVQGPQGGFLVPPDFVATIMQTSAEESVMRPLSTIVPISHRSIQIPALDQTSIPIAGQTAFFGGLQAYWVEEAQTRPETEPSFKQIELTARELSGYSVISRTLLADNAFGLNQILTKMFAKAIGWHEDFAFMHGNGVGKPRGISQSSAAISVNRTTSSTFKLADAANMWAKLLPASQTKAVWVMSQTIIPQLIQLADASGRVVFMPNPAATLASGGSMTQAMPMSLLGRPIIFTEKAPPIGSTADVMLIDPSYYLIGDRQSIEVMTSEHARFTTNQMVWRFIHRVDGQPWLDAPFTYSDGTTQISPFVILN